MYVRSLVSLFLFSSLAHADGVIIGHPVGLRFAAGTGLTYTSGSISVTDEVVRFCDDSTLTIPVDDTLAIGDTVLLPAGDICGVELLLDGPVLLTGTGNAGGSFTLSLSLSVVQIEVDPPLEVSASGTSDADAVELGAPDFVTASLLQLGPGITRTVTPGHALHDTLKASVRDESSIVR